MTDSPTPAPAPQEDGQPEAPDARADAGAQSPETALNDLLNRYTRLAADFDNFRKRTAREQVDRARYAAEPAARALLPVLDNLRRAVDAAPQDGDGGLLDGLRFLVRQFEEALASVGVLPIDAVGQPFDPAEHEAVMGEESDKVDVDTVVDELQRGYRIADRVIRPAMVRVAHPRHVAVPGGAAPTPSPRKSAPANGAVHHDLPGSPRPRPDGDDGWMEA